MSETSARRLLGHFGWKTLAEALSRGLSLLFLILLARRLGDTQYGLYSLPLASAGLFAVMLDPGSHGLLIRELARRPEREASLLAAVVGLRVVFSLGFLLLLLSSWLWLTVSPWRLLAAGCMLLGQSWIDTQVAWLNGRQAFRDEARLRFWLKLGLLLPQMGVLLLAPSIDGLLWAGALAHLAWLPVLGWRLAPTLAKARFNLAEFTWLLREGLGFWLANLSWLLYAKLDLVMLPWLGRAAAELGWYQAAVRFYELLSLPGFLLSVAAYPSLAQAHQPEQWRRQSVRLLRFELILGCLMAVTGSAVARLLPWLLGPDFTPTVAALEWMCLSIPAVCLNLGLFTLLGAAGKQRLTAWATGLSLACNAGLNLWLIPRSGYLGAAISTLVADLLLSALLWAGWLNAQPRWPSRR